MTSIESQLTKFSDHHHKRHRSDLTIHEEEENDEFEHHRKRRCSTRVLSQVISQVVVPALSLPNSAKFQKDFSISSFRYKKDGHDSELNQFIDNLIMDNNDSPSTHSEQSMYHHLPEEEIYSQLESLQSWSMPEYLRNPSSGIQHPMDNVYYGNLDTSNTLREDPIPYRREQIMRIRAQDEAESPFYDPMIGDEIFCQQELPIPMPFHTHLTKEGQRFKNLRCLLKPVRGDDTDRPGKCLLDCELQHVTERDYKSYNLFEIKLAGHSALPLMIQDICYNQVSPYLLVQRFDITHLFQPYIQVASWSEFEEIFSGTLLNGIVDNFLNGFQKSAVENKPRY